MPSQGIASARPQVRIRMGASEFTLDARLGGMTNHQNLQGRSPADLGVMAAWVSDFMGIAKHGSQWAHRRKSTRPAVLRQINQKPQRTRVVTPVAAFVGEAL